RGRHPGLAPGQRDRGGRGVSGAGEEPFIAAVKPLVDAIGGELLPPDEAGPDDVVLAWQGADAVAVRLPQLADSLDHILAPLERHPGLAPGQRDRGGRGVSGAGEEPFIAAVKPLVAAIGGELLPPDEAGPDDVVLAWQGADAVAVRLPQLADSLDHILAALER